jgi:3',5'-cyclic AMP phosphodiesterase CpdA
MDRREFIMAAGTLGALGLKSAELSADASPSARPHEPLVASPSETSAAISWATDFLATGSVEIGEKPDLSDARKVKSGEIPVACLDEQSLSARVYDLKPATKYYFRTVTQEIISARNPHAARIKTGRRAVGPVRSFTTPGAAAESRFAVINDTHMSWDSFKFVTETLRSLHAPAIVWNGDALNCTEEKRTAVEGFLRPQIPAYDFADGSAVHFLPGNHEYNGAYARHLDEVIPSRPQFERGARFADLKWNFAVRQGDIALIGMDTGEGLHDDDVRLCGLGSFSAYRKLQAQWLEEALQRPDIAGAAHAVMFCHIPLFNSGPNPNGCEKPRNRGCASWIRECSELWGPILDKHGVRLVVCGHEHLHRWDDNIPGFGWSQVLGGGPELGYGAGFVKDERYCPTVICAEVLNGRLVVSVLDAWRNKTLSQRSFAPRKTFS